MLEFWHASRVLESTTGRADEGRQRGQERVCVVYGTLVICKAGRQGY
jgi:hypothetical protein